MKRHFVVLSVLVCVCGAAFGGYYDTSFDTADAVAHWTVVAGSWTLDTAAGVYRANIATTGTAIAVYNGPLAWGGVASDLADYTVSTDVIVNGNDAALIARYVNSGNYYFYRYHRDQQVLQIYSVGGGTRKLAEAPAGAIVTPYTLSLTVKGDQLTGRVYVDGVLVATVTATDSLHQKGTVGCRPYSATSEYGSLHVTSAYGPINIAPKDGATGVSTEPVLRWATVEDAWGNADPNVAAHHLFVSSGGEDTSPDFVATIPKNGAEASYDELVLERDSTYYWRIEEAPDLGGGTFRAPGDANNIAGDVWRFETIKSVPVIQQQPQDVFVRVGEATQFTIVAATLSPEHYAWYRVVDGGDDVPVGGDSATLVIDPVQPEDAGFYYCIVTNDAGAAPASAVAELLLKRMSAHWTLDATDFVAGQYVDTAGGHNATIAGAAVNFVEGMDGTPNGAVVIDPNSWANAGTWNPAAQTGQFSVSMWLQWDGITGGHHRPIAKRGVDWASNMWDIQINQNTANIEFRSYDSGGPIGALAADNPAKWQHVCAVFNGVSAAMYIDGKLTQSRALNLTPAPDSPIILGAGASDGNLAFNGVLDDIRIYNYALSAEDVADIWYDVTGEPICVHPPDAAFDQDGDCLVTLADFAAFAGHWLECGFYPLTECP